MCPGHVQLLSKEPITAEPCEDGPIITGEALDNLQHARELHAQVEDSVAQLRGSSQLKRLGGEKGGGIGEGMLQTTLRS